MHKYNIIDLNNLFKNLNIVHTKSTNINDVINMLQNIDNDKYDGVCYEKVLNINITDNNASLDFSSFGDIIYNVKVDNGFVNQITINDTLLSCDNVVYFTLLSQYTKSCLSFSCEENTCTFTCNCVLLNKNNRNKLYSFTKDFNTICIFDSYVFVNNSKNKSLVKYHYITSNVSHAKISDML